MDIQIGDVILVRGKGFFPWMIRFFMYLKAIGHFLFNKRPLPPFSEMFNHAAVVVADQGYLMFDDVQYWVCEALPSGSNIRPISSTTFHKKGVRILRLVNPLNEDEKRGLVHKATRLTLEHHGYDFLNFGYNILKIFSFLFTKKESWYGPHGEVSEKRLYCSELVAVVINWVRPGTFSHSPSTDLWDIQHDTDFKIIKR